LLLVEGNQGILYTVEGSADFVYYRWTRNKNVNKFSSGPKKIMKSQRGRRTIALPPLVLLAKRNHKK